MRIDVNSKPIFDAQVADGKVSKNLHFLMQHLDHSRGISLKSASLVAAVRTRRVWRTLLATQRDALPERWKSEERTLAKLMRHPGRKGRYELKGYYAFVRDVGFAPPNARLYRVDPKKPYHVRNCVWVKDEKYRWVKYFRMDAEKAATMYLWCLKGYSISTIAAWFDAPRQVVKDLKRGRTWEDARRAACAALMPDLFGK